MDDEVIEGDVSVSVEGGRVCITDGFDMVLLTSTEALAVHSALTDLLIDLLLEP